MRSGQKREWKRQNWQDATAEIGAALEPTPSPQDTVEQISDSVIDDSPYQARARYDDAQLADLVQGMRETGFQGVLFVRAQPRGRYQLAYGHRRRRAWRLLCEERGVPCVLPSVVRPFSDKEMLTIGAQENLQRADLNPVEEAQLVAWHQKLYYPASLGEIGRLLGKSEDWAKTRARIGQLPEELKAVIQRSPQLMTGVLETSRLWSADAQGAQALLIEAEQDGLTLKQLRAKVAERIAPPLREEEHKQRVDAPDVQEITNERVATTRSSGDARSATLLAALGIGDADRSPAIAMEGRQIQAWLHQWERDSRNKALHESLQQQCTQLLHQLQQLMSRIAEAP